ncbi:CoA transferase [Henriciella mobilis]|nr:CoA transferase [Henriciella mobilis]
MPLTPLFHRLTNEIERLTGLLGDAVRLPPDRIFDRSDSVDLGPAGKVSANGSCRLLLANDGWLALNLPRETDLELIPALVEANIDHADWRDVTERIQRRPKREVFQSAARLGLAVSIPGEVNTCDEFPFVSRTKPVGASARGHRMPQVIDLSSLWAGPLCGSIFAEMGADVLKVESIHRMTIGAAARSPHHHRLNSKKRHLQLDFRSERDLEKLRHLLSNADIVITNGRRRAFEQMGIIPSDLMKGKPGLVWIAITGYGFYGPQSHRIAFGDDAAVAGGLVDLADDGSPVFMGDAIADPLTGLSAAIAAIELVTKDTGAFIDASLSRVAAGAARSSCQTTATTGGQISE